MRLLINTLSVRELKLVCSLRAANKSNSIASHPIYLVRRVNLSKIIRVFDCVMCVCTGRSCSQKVGGVSEVLTSEDGFIAELLLDSQNLVVFGETVGSARSSGLDLSGAESDDQVTDEVVLGLSTSVGNHDTPAGGLGEVAGLDGLSDGTDLVDLEEEGVAKFLVNSPLDSLGVSHEQIVTNDLNSVSHSVHHLLVRLSIILIEGVLNRHDRVLLDHSVVDIKETIGGKNSIVLSGFLGKVVGVSLGVVELGGGNIEADVDFAGVASVVDSLGNELEGLPLVLDLGGTEATLVTDVTSGDTELALQKLGEGVVNLNSSAEGFLERIGTSGEDHELLNFQTVSSVGTTVDDVEGGHGGDVSVGGLSSELSQVLVEGDASGVSAGTRGSEGNSKDRVGSELLLAPSPLVLGAVNLLDHLAVNELLLGDIESLEGGGDNFVHVLDGLEAALAEEAGRVLVSELEGLVDTGGGTGGNGSGEDLAIGGVHVGFNGGVTTGVDDLVGGDTGDGSGEVAAAVKSHGSSGNVLEHVDKDFCF